jgi:glycerol uptake facilitator-like aquaporin
MNPARSFGPFLAVGDLSHFWIYLVGPALGGLVVGVVQANAFDTAKEHA